MNIILLGAPGAGKGTHAQIVAERNHIPQISTGNIIRKELSANTDLGLEAKDYIENGKLVPDNVVIDMVARRLEEDDAKNGFILDGFPRTVPQAQALEEMGISIHKVIDIEVPDEVIYERLTGRRTCGGCGATFHISNNPSAKGNLCDKCGGELSIRKDDKRETIEQRLSIYHQQAEPLKSYYSAKNVLITIDSTLPLNQVIDAVEKALEA